MHNYHYFWKTFTHICNEISEKIKLESIKQNIKVKKKIPENKNRKRKSIF